MQNFEQIKLDKQKELIDIKTPCVPIDISNVDMLCRFFGAEISSKSKDVITVKMPDSDQLLYLPQKWCNEMYIKMER